MFNSAFAEEDAIFDLDGYTINGLSAIRTQILDHVGPMDTTHMISNIRVDVKDGADTASLAAYVLVQHCPPGTAKKADGPNYLVGGEIWIDLVRDEGNGLWKIKKWVLDIKWGQGDASVLPMPR